MALKPPQLDLNIPFDHPFIDMPELVPVDASEHDNVAGQTASEDGARRDTQSVALVKLLEDQTQVLRHLVEKQGEVIESLAGLHGVLSRIDNRQAAADHTWQPIPQIPATSSSAWNPLYDSMMQKSITPAVDRWKGTLDTLLIFIALFSAIVTAFYVQSSSGLSPDATFETNQLLSNLTDVVILLSGVNASQLSLRAPVAFEPDASALRLSFYWSTSLVLSISIASLAVASRGYLALLTRSRYKQTYKKLTDIRGRWQQAKRQLGPLIDTLPQLLIISVLLFLAGLLDSMISDWLSTSPRSGLALAAVIMAVIYVATAGMIIIYTFIHGCLYSSKSSFQSTASRVVETLTTRLHPPQDENPLDIPLMEEELETFYASIQTTHDDSSLDLAASALHGTLEADFWSQAGYTLSRGAVRTVRFLLSSEASVQSNVTAASAISRLYRISTGVVLHNDRAALLRALISAAERCSATMTGYAHSRLLWNSEFAKVMAYIIVGSASHEWTHVVLDGYSTLMPLFSYDADTSQSDILNSSYHAAKHALSVIEAKLYSYLPLAASESDQKSNEHLLDMACDTMLASLTPVLVNLTDGALERAFISSVCEASSDRLNVSKTLVRWFSRTKGIRFVAIAIQETARQNSNAWLNVLDHLTTFKVSPNPEEDSRLLVLELTKSIANLRFHQSDYWGKHTVKLPFCNQREDCDGFCFFADSIIQLLEKARSLVVDLPFADVETLGVTWEALSLALAPVTEDTLRASGMLVNGWHKYNAATLEHLNEVRTCILEAFRPFFESASRSE